MIHHEVHRFNIILIHFIRWIGLVQGGSTAGLVVPGRLPIIEARNTTNAALSDEDNEEDAVEKENAEENTEEDVEEEAEEDAQEDGDATTYDKLQETPKDTNATLPRADGFTSDNSAYRSEATIILLLSLALLCL
jgi:hypothetical protein